MKVAKVTRAAPVIGQVKEDIDRVFDLDPGRLQPIIAAPVSIEICR